MLKKRKILVLGLFCLAYRILVSSPVPLGLIGWNQVGLGWNWSWGDWELKGLGLELDKSPQKNTNGMTDTNQTFIALSYKYMYTVRYI